MGPQNVQNFAQTDMTFCPPTHISDGASGGAVTSFLDCVVGVLVQNRIAIAQVNETSWVCHVESCS